MLWKFLLNFLLIQKFEGSKDLKMFMNQIGDLKDSWTQAARWAFSKQRQLPKNIGDNHVNIDLISGKYAAP